MRKVEILNIGLDSASLFPFCLKNKKFYLANTAPEVMMRKRKREKRKLFLFSLSFFKGGWPQRIGGRKEEGKKEETNLKQQIGGKGGEEVGKFDGRRGCKKNKLTSAKIQLFFNVSLFPHKKELDCFLIAFFQINYLGSREMRIAFACRRPRGEKSFSH